MKNPAYFDKNSGDVSWRHYCPKHDLDTLVESWMGARGTQILFRLKNRDPNYYGSDNLMLD